MNEQTNILVVDDLPGNHLVYQTVLAELGQNLILARSGAEALQKVLEHEFAVILLDVNMPDMTGLETGALIRRHKKAAHTPIIFITAYADEAETAEGYALGAVDYIPSPVVPAILRTKVKVFVELDRMRAVLAQSHQLLEQRVAERTTELSRANAALQVEVAERRRAEERLAQLANYDALTELPNRRYFNERLQQAIGRAERHGTRLALMLIDLDNFKLINDSLGHDQGDALLRAAAIRMKDCLRAEDTLARLSGDEFTVLLEDIGAAREVARTARRLVQSLAAPLPLARHEISIGASLGISVFPADGADLSTLMKNADTAMYRAKRRGKNAYRFFTEDMNREAMDRLLIETGLRRAVEQAELRLHYQPIVDLASLKTVGAEALVRWPHPEMGLIPPARFVPIAEECGLIGPLDEWVLAEACRAARTWPEGLRVAVNISPRHFRHRQLARTIEEAIERAQLPADRLEIELTEAAVMEDPASSAEVLRRLKALGVRVAIDDFGTGYSSLGYLKRFPIDRLKIDRSFIQEVTTDGEAAAITTAVITLAHSLKMKVIAEGVETADQLAALKAQSCDEAQGYYFGEGRETIGGAARSRNASGLVGAAAQ
ncbi:MAG: putative bifunctional diguanylate cyclase/phosphodiesterase [Gammaproteobacteria bacterium]